MCVAFHPKLPAVVAGGNFNGIHALITLNPVCICDFFKLYILIFQSKFYQMN